MSSALPLQEGDLIDVVAPGSAVSSEVLTQSEAFFKTWGLRGRIPKNILNPTTLHSNTDSMRFELLKKALLAPDSKVIWSLRGGYGSNRLLPQLMKLKKPQHKKIFIGISDVTSIHVFLNQEWGWPTLHASLLDRLAQGKLLEACASELQDVLFGRVKELKFDLQPMNAFAKKRNPSLSAKIVGGNLVTLESAIGTPSDFNTDGKFLFLEELNERGYRVDRILEHFRQSGKFKKCKGLLLGHFIGGAESNGAVVWKEVLENWAKELKIPVYQGLESGHGDHLRALPLGTKAQIVYRRSGVSLHVETGIQ